MRAMIIEKLGSLRDNPRPLKLVDMPDPKAETLIAADPNYKVLAQQIDERLLSENIKIVRNHRNKRVAHSDYETYVTKGVLPTLKNSTISPSTQRPNKIAGFDKL